MACGAYHTDTGLNTDMVRIFNCHGPKESLDPDSSHVIPSLCRKVIEEPDGGAIELFGDGSQERGFIYISDLVEGMVIAMDRAVSGEPINLGNGEAVVSINDLAETIITISGKDLTIEHDLTKPTGTDKYAADTDRMEAILDWTPSVGIEEGLETVYEWAERELRGTRHVATADGGHV